MAKKKRYRGHYCKVCGNVLANERFSGKGHSSHICEKCSTLPLEERNERIDLNRIYGLFGYSNLSKVNKLMLQNYLKSGSEKVRLAAKGMLDEFSKTARFMRTKDEEYEEMLEMDIENDEFSDDYEDDDSIEDLHRIDGDLDLFSDTNDELPF